MVWFGLVLRVSRSCNWNFECLNSKLNKLNDWMYKSIDKNHAYDVCIPFAHSVAVVWCGVYIAGGRVFAFKVPYLT